MNRNNQALTKISFYQKITLVIFGIFLTVVILIEIGLRICGFVLLSVQEYGNRISISKRGSYRIMCLGESTTAGQYPRFLEEILNQHNTGVKFSVIDKGVYATNTGLITSYLETNLDKYQPDLVVTMMGINDVGVHIPYEAPTQSKVRLFFRSLRVYKLIRLLGLHVATKAREMQVYTRQRNNQSSEALKRNTQDREVKVAVASPCSVVQQGEVLKEATESSGMGAQDYSNLGLYYWNQGRLDEGEAAFKKAIELNSESAEPYHQIDNLYRERYTEEERYKEAKEFNPKNVQGYLFVGEIFRSLSKYVEAEEAYKKALELNPRSFEIYFVLSDFYRDLGKYREQEIALKKGLELNPLAIYGYHRLIWVYRMPGKQIEAEPFFKKFIEESGSNNRDFYYSSTYGVLAILYSEMRNYKLAEEWWEKADKLCQGYYDDMTRNNYRRLKLILDRRKIKHVCVQYPVRSVESLKKILEGLEGSIFVDNEKIFKDAIKKEGFNLSAIFTDMFGGNFGHCTEKGNRLLAENIADVILKEVFHK